jgi:hypothetical protein
LRSGLSTEIADHKRQADERSERLAQAQAVELELRTEKRNLEEREKARDLEMARKLDDERVRLQHEISTRLEEEHARQVAEKDKRLSDAMKANDERWTKSIADHGIGSDRDGNILEALLAQISELSPDLAPDLIVGRRRDADAAGFGDALKPRCDVNAVPKNVMLLDDYVTDIDAHVESNALVFRVACFKFVDAILELHSSPNRLDRTRKLRQEPVASVLHDATAVLRDRGFDTAREERCQFDMRSLFVAMHEP